MDFIDKKYVIGIDLGTTNCAVSYVDVTALRHDQPTTDTSNSNKKAQVKVFNIPQLTGHGEFTRSSVLPSFLYLPGEYDISKEVLKHPWKKREDLFAGRFARDHGSKIPSRLVASAKSWLCNSKADRRAKILPWGSKGFDKVSPVIATSEYLNHIKQAWNHFVKDEDDFLENQFVVITVPASFNEEARNLTMEAIKITSMGASVTLLEEPLAAFYSWLIEHETNWHQIVKADDLILVCDVGGGTTDFSLISLKESKGNPRFERIAVGEHLILGGDNIDLALAKRVEAKFKSQKTLNSDKWKTLCYRCREAKEKILESGDSSVRITIKGEGRSLIAGTLAADLTREEVETVLNEVFYPDVNETDLVNIDAGKEITDFGLPFEKESAVTRHIINFLEKHRIDVQKQLNKEPVPDFILFNGGTLKPHMVQQRTINAIRKWFGCADENQLRVLENKNPELAVGIGASYYGLVKQGKGVRVGSGSPRSYYLGITVKEDDISKAMCLVERGLDEGAEIDLPHQQYEVIANQPVSFNIYSSSYRSGDVAGDIIDVDDSIVAMTPIQTVIRFGKKSDKKVIPVSIGARFTEMGTLFMFCQSGISEHRWELQFQLRDQNQAGMSRDTIIYEKELINRALELVDHVFDSGVNDDSELKTIAKYIEKIVGQKKSNWPLSFLRKLADELIRLKNCRRCSADHELRWLNLMGFCIRPGFGDALDEERIRTLWKIYLEGPLFEKAKQNKLEWWIFIRRIAAGLKAGQQRQFFQDVSPTILKKRKMKLPPQEQSEFIMTLGNMERLLVKDKISLANAFLNMLKPGKKQNDLYWALSRLGARELLYGSVDRVIPAKEILKWTNRLLKLSWKSNDPIENLIVQVARMTGDRTRDIDEVHRSGVIRWLQSRKFNKKSIKKVSEVIEIDVKEQNIQFGETLPAGLILKKYSKSQ